MNAMDHFEQYLVLMEMPPSVELSEEQACDILLFDQFAYYLEIDAEDEDGEYLQAEAACQYFSDVQAVISNKFNSNSFWMVK